MLPQLLSSGPPTSMTRRASHPDPVQSARRGVTYYVPDRAAFEARNPKHSESRTRLERNLEAEYGDYLMNSCREEVLRERWGHVRSGSRKPACDELELRYSEIHTGYSQQRF